MTHGPGSQTPGRKVPPPPRDAQPAKPSPFQPSHDTNDVPKTYTPRMRPRWEQSQDPTGTPPGLSRSQTTHGPKRTGFTPSTLGGDEPPARNSSAYYNVSRGGARPQVPRAETQFPPPPPRTTPTSQKPTPPTPNLPRSYRPPSDGVDPFGNSDRISTPYATSGGEKTYFSSTGIGRSASTRSNDTSAKSSGGFPPHVASPLSPGTNGRRRSASPNMKIPNPQRSYSTSSSSAGESDSSDEGISRKQYARRASADHHRPTVPLPAQDHRRPSYQHLRPEDVDLGEKYSQSKYSSVRDPREKSGSNGIPKQYANSQPGSRNRSPSSDTPGGFFQHRMKRDAERANRPATPLQTASSCNNEGPGRPLEKSKSWQEKYGSMEGGNNQRAFDPPTSGDTKETRPMYESPEYNSFPSTPPCFDWVNIESPDKHKRPRTSSASWPYWAIPSSIKPNKQVEPQSTQAQSPWNQQNLLNMMRKANFNALNSFNCKINNDTSSTSTLKSPSVENINTNFSPSGFAGKFTGNGDEYPGSTSGYRSNGRASPPKGRGPTQGPPRGHPISTSSTHEGQNGTTKMPPPPSIPIRPPSPGQAKFPAEEWQQHFKEPHWAFPTPQQPVPSPRIRDPKRPKTPRSASTVQKRSGGPKPATVFNGTDDSADDGPPNGAAGVVESDLSQSSGSGSAMDIDPTFTPPSDQKPQHEQRTVNTDTENVPQPTSASKQPRSEVPSKLDTDLNLGTLKNVAPIAPNNSGLKNLDDLNTTLPFESRPSNLPARPLTPQRLLLPHPPKAPSIPGKLTQSSFEYYIIYMRAYMVEWNVFNKKMLAHFNTRQEEVEHKLGNDWIGAIGEEGYAKYMRGVEEDFRVREHWNVSWEKHKGFMEGLGQVRESAVTGKLTV